MERVRKKKNREKKKSVNRDRIHIGSLGPRACRFRGAKWKNDPFSSLYIFKTING
jgi:hypothetical protein